MIAKENATVLTLVEDLLDFQLLQTKFQTEIGWELPCTDTHTHTHTHNKAMKCQECDEVLREEKTMQGKEHRKKKN